MMETIALIMFILMYVLMIVFSDKKYIIASSVALLFITLGILPLNNIISAIDFNVLLMMSGTMLIVYYFIESKMPNLIADYLLNKASNILWLTILMSAFAGAVSAFIDNTATVLMIAPVGIAVCKKLKINPIPMILSIAVSSNLQGAATLVGDTTSIMLSAYADINFIEFFILNGKLSIFFAVELGALASLIVIYFIFRKQKDKINSDIDVSVNDYIPTIFLIILIISLIIASFIPNKSDIINGIICISIAIIVMLFEIFKTKKSNSILNSLRSLDYQTLILLTSLFLVIEGVKDAGIIDDFAKILINTGGNNTFLLYTIIVIGSALISGFIDNIPYVATMLPVVSMISTSLGINPYLLYFGLLSGSTLGGNLTPFGASANIAAVGILKKAGYKVSFKDFIKIGIPLTLAALITGYLFIWFIWH